MHKENSKETKIDLVKISKLNGDLETIWSPILPVEDGYPSLRDEIWNGTFGQLQNALMKNKEKLNVILCLSDLGWADPLPLLALGTSLRGFIETTGSTLTIEIGLPPTKRYSKRGMFLKFLIELKWSSFFVQHS
ncbi:MAG: hypothetical protein KZQ83_12535 [gamma proteobacterium symbiont of Taylorina sp.]|nr:hypothetical protein [gamma proteobacterium symbiont of Taylorina sp.]